MKTPTFSKGDKVKVDLSGSGKAYKFVTINESFETDNCNGYRDYTFDELGDIRMSEYYIRKVTKSDLKMKKLCETQKADEFNFDDNKVLQDFWVSQERNIESSINYINDFLHPYLLEYKHVLTVEKMVDWNSYYKKGMHRKNGYVFAIPHEYLKIMVIQNTTHITMYIITNAKYGEKSLGVYDIDVEYSDEECTGKMMELAKNIIEKYEECCKKEYYHYIHPDYKKIDEVKDYNSFFVKGCSDDWLYQIPSNYVVALRELNYMKHYFFNKGFE